VDRLYTREPATAIKPASDRQTRAAVSGLRGRTNDGQSKVTHHAADIYARNDWRRRRAKRLSGRPQSPSDTTDTFHCCDILYHLLPRDTPGPFLLNVSIFMAAPYGIGQAIIFLPCGFFLSSFFLA